MGDQVSYHPGWQEGAIHSAFHAIADIDRRVRGHAAAVAAMNACPDCAAAAVDDVARAQCRIDLPLRALCHGADGNGNLAVRAPRSPASNPGT